MEEKEGKSDRQPAGIISPFSRGKNKIDCREGRVLANLGQLCMRDQTP